MATTLLAGKRTAMRMTLTLLALTLVGAAAPVSAADLIFADSFESCCTQGLTLGGTVTGLTGAGLVLHLAAGAVNHNQSVPVQSGTPQQYTFSQSVPQGTSYLVTITTQPDGQSCTLSNATGTMGNTAINDIDAVCVDEPAGLLWDSGWWDHKDWQ